MGHVALINVIARRFRTLPILALAIQLAACTAAAERPKLAANATQDDRIAASGQLYLAGDTAGALALLRPVAEEGNARAQSQLGMLYFTGEGVPQDYQQAAYWFKKSADQGNAGGQTNLGSMHLNGKGMPQNYVEAARLLTLAAEQNTGIAQSKLGIMYGEGTGVPKDLVQAYVWFTLAINNDVPDTRTLRDGMLRYMSADEIADCEARAKAWKPTLP